MGEGKRRDAAGRVRLPFDSLEEGWRLIAGKTVPPDVPEGVRAAMRHFFMMGAGCFFDLMMHRMDPGEDPTSADLRRMDALYAEIEAFRRSMLEEATKRGTPPGAAPH